ncbi:MAG: hypothetical protein ACI4BH_08615 [Muribaculaceae bacterium]
MTDTFAVQTYATIIESELHHAIIVDNIHKIGFATRIIVHMPHSAQRNAVGHNHKVFVLKSSVSFGMC